MLAWPCRPFRSRRALYRMVRPAGNELDGYGPSYGLRRAAEEIVG